MTDPKRATVVVHHSFSSSAARVFDAFLDAETAGKFLFATPAGTMVRAETDPRVGGRFTFVDLREGREVLHTGEYLELERPRRIVFTLQVPAYSSEYTRVEVDFRSLEESCDVTITHFGVSMEVSGRMTEGWTDILNTADAILRQV